VRQLELVTARAIGTDQEPSREPLLKVVFRIAAGRLNGLHKLRLNIPQYQGLKFSAVDELFSRVVNGTGEALAGNLCVDAIQTLLGLHQHRYTNDGLVAKQQHRHLDLRSVYEMVVIEAIPSSTK
jgi:hypothetical protein